MKKFTGIWLDVKGAILVSYKIDAPGQSDDAPETPKPRVQHLSSDIENKVRLSGGSRTRKTPYGPQNISDDKKLQRRRQSELHHYFDDIITKVKDSEKLLILGPGDAKNELKKQIEHSHKILANKVIVKTTDKMTENQIIAEIRDYFRL